ncbi:MAG TPA: hypothetical protein DDX92_07380 [Flavobacteriales bacterium]|nr:hypothetical protein [Flavobacteriales bacterium]
MNRFLLFIILFSSLPGHAQTEFSNLRTKTIQVLDTLELDTLSIAPGTFKVLSTDIAEEDYYLDCATSTFSWRTKPNIDSVKVEYRVWNLDLSSEFFHKDTTNIREEYSTQPYLLRQKTQVQKPFQAGGLDKSGSISRGALFGNNQNLGVNSNLNLQLSGKLTDKINIKAVISDQNIPVQPEGNTQQLQDFDQVYIQLYDDKSQLTAGDFQITSSGGHFMRYNKRLRGGGATTAFRIKKDLINSVQLSGAVSRGKFARNVFNGTEGNQGPYRLEGTENEGFIIILSGTEVVYIDGRKLERGQDRDYIIDYNSSEITFTARQPITKDKRIVVEFQYTSQAYARSLIQFSDNLKGKNFEGYINVYSEQDNKNRPLLQDITDDNILLLESIGDNIDEALVESSRTVDFSTDRVLYKKVPGPDGDSIFVFSTNPDSARFQVSFSNVGSGNGDYVEKPSTANGRVFEYTNRSNGVSQGNYAPVVLLVTPKKRQMVTAGGSIRIGKRGKLITEGALTVFDNNRFSEIDSQDDLGFGAMLDYQQSFTFNFLGRKSEATSSINYEQRSDNFGIIERYRSVEFDRDWNIRGLPVSGSQYLPGVGLHLRQDSSLSIRYDFKSFIAGSSYAGYKNGLSTQVKKKGVRGNYVGSYLVNRGDLQSADFYRHKINFQKDIGFLTIGYRDDLENNMQRNSNNESLLQSAYRFYEWEAYVANRDTTGTYYKLGYIRRTDDFAKQNSITPTTLGQSIVGQLKFMKDPKKTLVLFGQYRTLEVFDSELYNGTPEETFTARTEYTLKLLKGAVSLSSFYEVGSGLEEERSFVYIEVPAGTGVYTWIDYNENGIQEQDEFEVAPFPDQATYIRILSPTNNFRKVYRTQFNQTALIQPQVVWRREKGLKKFLTLFSDQLAYRIDRNTTLNSLSEWINPFNTDIADSSIISINSSFRNTLYINRTSSLWSVDYTYQNLSSKALQTNGLTGRNTLNHRINLRYNLTRIYQINIEGSQGTKRSGAEITSTRDFYITSQTAKPSITYLQGAGVRITISYEWANRINSADFGGERNESQNAGAEIQVNSAGKSSMTIKVNYINNAYDGEQNSAVAFEMLQGLDIGTNGVWELVYQRTIAKYLQLNVTYNGRVSEGNSAVHTGGIQLRAYF